MAEFCRSNFHFGRCDGHCAGCIDAMCPNSNSNINLRGTFTSSVSSPSDVLTEDKLREAINSLKYQDDASKYYHEQQSRSKKDFERMYRGEWPSLSPQDAVMGQPCLDRKPTDDYHITAGTIKCDQIQRWKPEYVLDFNSKPVPNNYCHVCNKTHSDAQLKLIGYKVKLYRSLLPFDPIHDMNRFEGMHVCGALREIKSLLHKK